MREKIIEVGICFEEFINLVVDTFAVAIWSKTLVAVKSDGPFLFWMK